MSDTEIADIPDNSGMLTLWTYHRPVNVDGVPYNVRVATGFTGP